MIIPHVKPKVFIGSSSEYMEIAEAIQINLASDTYSEIWNQSITKLSQSTLQNLIDSLSQFDFAIFVLGGEDKAEIRSENVNIPRDNIIFEIGLFMGKLGYDHVFIVKPNGLSLHIPTDLLGITYGVYEPNHPNKHAALQPFCFQVKKQIGELINIDFPKEGKFGLNLLNDEVKECDNSSNDNWSYYDMNAKTVSTQMLRVELENKSLNGNENLWFYDPISRLGWVISDYNKSNGKQSFELLPNNIGMLKIPFKGYGSAILSVFVNDSPKPYFAKTIVWK